MSKVIDITSSDYAEYMISFLNENDDFWKDYCKRQFTEHLSIAEYIVKYRYSEFYTYVKKKEDVKDATEFCVTALLKGHEYNKTMFFGDLEECRWFCKNVNSENVDKMNICYRDGRIYEYVK